MSTHAPTILTFGAQLGCQRTVAGHHHSAVPERAKIFRWIKAEAGHFAEAAERLPPRKLHHEWLIRKQGPNLYWVRLSGIDEDSRGVGFVIPGVHEKILLAHVRAEPDATLVELREWLAAERSVGLVGDDTDLGLLV